MSELTMEDIKKAMNLIKEENTCKKCGTERNLMVLGICGIDYVPLFCKCEAERLCKTPHVKKLKEKLKIFVDKKCLD